MPNSELYNERELLARIAAGNEAAFRRIFNEHADFLLSYVIKLTHQHEMAEELVQDIFLQVWQARESVERIRDFKSYLFIITRNHALNALKKLARQQRKLKELEGRDVTTEQQDAMPEVAYLSLIDEAIEQLPPQQKQVWIMSRREGKKYADIAQHLNLSKETVKKYLQYATASIIEYTRKRIDLLLLAWFFGSR